MAHEIAHVTARHAFLRAEQEKTRGVDRAGGPRSSKAAKERRRVEASSARDHRQLFPPAGVRSRSHRHRRDGARRLRPLRRLALSHRSLGRSSEMRAELIGQGDSGRSRIFWRPIPRRRSGSRRRSRSARQFGAPGVGDEGAPEYLGRDRRHGCSATIRWTARSVAAHSFIHAWASPSRRRKAIVLENSSQAVLGVASGGAEALRFDSVRAPATKA